jgi:hypothetical protein
MKNFDLSQLGWRGGNAKNEFIKLIEEGISTIKLGSNCPTGTVLFGYSGEILVKFKRKVDTWKN